jgi:predicted ATPase
VPERKRGLERAGLASPMVGRQSQLATLRSLYDVVAAGRGRVAFLVGEPGIGKSRLLAEFQRFATGGGSADEPVADAGADANARWVEGHCVSYGRNLPYHLVLDLARSLLGLPVLASGSEMRATLDRQLLEFLGDEAVDTAPFLAHLLDLPLHPQEAAQAMVEPETMQIRYIASIHRLLRALSARSPVVLVCEDMHWADPSSVEVMSQILPLAAQFPVFLIATLRAETDSGGWRLMTAAREMFGASMTEIRLEPLSATESRDLVANLLEIESLPGQVRDVILARAEGNPFFVEEVIRMLIGHGAIERRGDRWIATGDVESVEIPETLQGLLLARIDQLPDAAKRSLRVASVIGRQFPVRVLERVLGQTSA